MRVAKYQLSLIVPLICLLGIAAWDPPQPKAATQSVDDKSDTQVLLDLKQGSVEQRKAAARELGKRAAASDAIIAGLARALSDADPDVRVFAAQALGKLGPPAAKTLPQIVSHFDDRAMTEGDLPVWYEMAVVAGGFGKAAIPEIRPLLDPAKGTRCRAAGIAVHELGAEAEPLVPELTKVLEAGDPRVTNEILHGIIGMGPAAKETLPAVIHTLDSENMHNQYWACRALGSMGSVAQPASTDLIRVLATEEVSVRHNAAAALGQIGPGIGPDGVQALIHALEDYSTVVREDAMRALAALGEHASAAAPIILKQLDDGQLRPIGIASLAYYKITGETKPIEAHILGQFSDLDGAVDVSGALVEMGPGAKFATEKLIEASKGSDPVVRLLSTRALGAIGEPSSAVKQALTLRLIDPDTDVREAAAKSLSQLNK